MKFTEWLSYYDKRKDKCVEELKEQGYDVELEDVEIYENGGVHFKGKSRRLNNLVTTWVDSEFFVD